MIYAFIAMFLLGLASGGFAAHEISQAEIERLRSAIERSNAESLVVLERSRGKVLTAEHEANKFNQQLQVSHEQAIATINDYSLQLDSRLYDHQARCKNTMSESTSPGVHPENDTNGTELSTEFTAFLYSENKRAELAALDKNALLTYVKNNCGIRED